MKGILLFKYIDLHLNKMCVIEFIVYSDLIIIIITPIIKFRFKFEFNVISQILNILTY